MSKGINCISEESICPACELEMRKSYVVYNLGRFGGKYCQWCGKKTLTMVCRYTLRGHEYDKRGIEMVFED